MRKTLLCSLLLFGATGAMAQEFHFSGGYNGSNVREAGNELWVGKAGYQFGADVLIGNRAFVKPGVHFLVRNLNYTFSNGTDVTAQNYTYTGRSLSVPVMVGLRLLDPANDTPVNVYIQGGPTALIALSTKLGNDELTVETTGTQWYIGFGGGVTFSFLFVEAGYNAAMTNVFKGEEFNTNPKVNFMYASAGVRLMLAK